MAVSYLNLKVSRTHYIKLERVLIKPKPNPKLLCDHVAMDFSFEFYRLGRMARVFPANQRLQSRVKSHDPGLLWTFNLKILWLTPKGNALDSHRIWKWSKKKEMCVDFWNKYLSWRICSLISVISALKCCISIAFNASALSKRKIKGPVSNNHNCDFFLMTS